MTTFKSAFTPAELTIEQGLDNTVSITVRDLRGVGSVVHVDPADDAAIALTVMDAARRGEESSWDLESAAYARQTAISWLMTAHDRAAEEADTTKREAARNRRRDELANELADSGFEYSEICDHTQRAIDRIIDMEETR